MAQRVQVEVIDDLDRTSPAARTLSFGLDGREYEIDLSEEHAAELTEAMRPFTERARKVPATRRHSAPRAPKLDHAAVREWAQAAGMPVSARGRIPASVIDAYQAAP